MSSATLPIATNTNDSSRSSETFRSLLGALLEEHERVLHMLGKELKHSVAPTKKIVSIREWDNIEMNSAVQQEGEQFSRRERRLSTNKSYDSMKFRGKSSDALSLAAVDSFRNEQIDQASRAHKFQQNPSQIQSRMRESLPLSARRRTSRQKGGCALLQPWQDGWKTLNIVVHHTRGGDDNRSSGSDRRSRYSMRSGKTASLESSVAKENIDCLICLDEFVEPFITNPGSTFKSLWTLGCLCLLVYDICVVPMDYCIGMPESLILHVMEWTIRVFWNIDLVLNFFTSVFIDGNLEKRLSRIVRVYARSWLLFDILLVSGDWLEAGSADWFEGTSLLPLLRAARLLRLMRLLRAAKLQQFFSDLLVLAPDVIVFSGGILRVAICTCILIHILACLWFAVGTFSEHGWASNEATQTATLGRKYILAVHWMETQLHGTSSYAPSSTLEYSFGALTTFIFFINMAIFIAVMTQAVRTLKDRSKVKLAELSRRYMKNRKVSGTLKICLDQYIKRSHYLEFKEQVEREAEFIMSLPQSLQMDLTEEIRKPLLLEIRFFRELQVVSPRVLRLICFEALSSVVCMRKEYLFLFGGVCKRMLCVEHGQLHYVLGGKDDIQKVFTAATTVAKAHSKDTPPAIRGYVQPKKTYGLDWSATSADIVKNRFWVATADESYEVVTRGVYLSEAALYVHWTNQGDLVAVRDSTFVALEASKYHEVVTMQEASSRIAVAYAQHYVAELEPKLLSDLMVFEVNFSNLFDILNVSSGEHFIFLSHFKQEAGTEAALMAENLEKMITEDAAHVASSWSTICFLDSSDLIELDSLRAHVHRSHNLLLLLTPNVLLRPWCLIEICTAVHASVNIVPVEVQRTGIKFQYPDDSFYEALQNGGLLEKEDVVLLQGEGLDLTEVVKCIRYVFNKIAMPFSPHKSVHVRQAELDDILTRCTFVGEPWEGEEEHGEFNKLAGVSRGPKESLFLGDVAQPCMKISTL